MVYRVEAIDAEGFLCLEKNYNGNVPLIEEKSFNLIFNDVDDLDDGLPHGKKHIFNLYYLDPKKIQGGISNKDSFELKVMNSKTLMSSHTTSTLEFNDVFGDFYDEYMLRQDIVLATNFL